ncbi:MAG: hypothetical protein GY710_06135 [Desulfobacteraceae bacterium]|nr:hypothetical protein [Desulfobacteraceae bacterium]
MADENNTDTQNNTNVSEPQQAAHWTSNLSDENRSHFVGMAADDVAKNYRDMADRLRTPMSIEGYSYEGKEDVAMIREIAHAIGATQSQYEGMIEGVLKAGKKGSEEALQNVEKEKLEVKAQLQKEWGADFEKNVENASAVVEKLPKEIKEMILKKGPDGKALANNPAVIKLFHTLHGLVREDSWISGPSSKAGPTMVHGKRALNFKKF